MNDWQQSREQTGTQVRASMRADVVDIVRRARLSDFERTMVLEYLETAITHDRQDGDLGGARYLVRMASDGRLGSLEDRLGPTLEAAATYFVRPA